MLRKKLFRKKGGFSYRHIVRYGEIASVFIKHGLGDLLSHIKIERYFHKKKISGDTTTYDISDVSKWDRIRMALTELGPAFVKLGQFASNRPDFFPAPLIASLEKLQDAVLPFDENSALKIVKEEFGKEADILFAEFNRTPFASASIAQVHRARLHDGSEVAVKIQRPDILDTIIIDCEIMLHIAALVEKHMQGMNTLEPRRLVEEFTNALYKELDFAIEAMHIKKFAENFKNDPSVHIPAVYPACSSRRVITTELINGIKVTSIDEHREWDFDRRLIATRGASAILRQIFVHGFFHADPHAGNILIESGNVVCFLDLGMTGILTPTSRFLLSSIIIGIARQNPRKITAALAEMSGRPIPCGEELEYEVSEMVAEYSSCPIRSIDIGEVLGRILKLMSVHRIRMMPGFYLLIKAIVTIEGVALKLDPEFNMMDHLEPFVSTMIREQYGLRPLLRDGRETAADLLKLLRDLPAETREILHLVKSGHARMEFEHKGLDPVIKKIDQVVNRLVFGLVLASLVIGSSIVILSDIPPKVYGLPLIGLAGFLAAGVMGFWLLISIISHEKM